jgi:hypothetical protein
VAQHSCASAKCHTSDEVAVYQWEHRERIELHLLPKYSVSGRSKPASAGRLRTSHFEETQGRRFGSGASPLPPEPDHVEPAQDGRD